MIITKRALPRRTVLRGAGAALVLPLLDAMVAPLTAQADTPAAPARLRRLGFVFMPMGSDIARWTPPGGPLLDRLSPTLEPLEPVKEHVTVVSNLELLNAYPGTHSSSNSAFLSAAKAKHTESSDYFLGTTVDQIAARELGKDRQLPSLELAIDLLSTVGQCDNGFACVYQNCLSWSSPTTPLPAEAHPRIVFERLFGEGGGPAERRAALKKRASLLDAVSEDFARLKRELGPADRARVTGYLESIREVERRIQNAEADAKQNALPDLDRPIGVPAAYAEHARLMFDLQVLALQGDITRVTTFQLARETSNRTYPEIGVPDPHHPLTHHGNDPEKIARMAKINRFHVSLFAYFLERLKATPEGDGSLLDHSLLLYGSGMGNPNVHDHTNLPILVAGGAAGGMKGGRHIRYAQPAPLANLHLTLLDKVGVRLGRFGDSTGKMDELFEPLSGIEAGAKMKILLALLLFASPALAARASAPLADAMEKQDAARVQSLLRQGANPDAAQVDGMTALHWACHYDDLAAAKRLLAAHAAVNAANRYGVRPLSLACTSGDTELVELLLRAGADPNTGLPGGESALMTAARTGRVGPVRALLARKASVNAKERGGQTAIMWAAAEGHARVVRLLIQAGADFRTPLPSGFTPLCFAAREGRREVAQVLLKAGADVGEAMQPRRSGGKNPRKGTSPLLLAVENGHFELALDLVKAGADPNDQRSGYSPLHALSWVRRPKSGDDPDGDPPPAESGTISSLQFVRELVARGADVNARLEHGAGGRGKLNEQGATPFLFAARTADVPLMRALVECGADPKIPNADRCPPLLAAAGVGVLAPGEEPGTDDEVIEAVRYILALGADVNAVDANGETAMHGAAYRNAPRAAAFLAARGADIKTWNRANNYGWTPLLIAEGHRVGNFKPAPETIAEIRRIMAGNGVTPPEHAPANE